MTLNILNDVINFPTCNQSSIGGASPLMPSAPHLGSVFLLPAMAPFPFTCRQPSWNPQIDALLMLLELCHRALCYPCLALIHGCSSHSLRLHDPPAGPTAAPLTLMPPRSAGSDPPTILPWRLPYLDAVTSLLRLTGSWGYSSPPTSDECFSHLLWFWQLIWACCFIFPHILCPPPFPPSPPHGTGALIDFLTIFPHSHPLCSGSYTLHWGLTASSFHVDVLSILLRFQHCWALPPIM